MINKIRQTDKWKLVIWGLLLVLLAVYFVSLYYPDIYITYRHSLTFLDCIKNGELFNFYQISLQTQSELGYAATYFIPIYIIFAIWNFPIWIATRFCGISAENAGCLLWSKSVIIVFAMASIYVLIQIMKRMSEYKKIEFSVFLFASSLFFVLPSFAMSQYDIIECFFVLCGIYYYMKDEKISWRVWLFFSIAVSVKLMAVFILLMLILLIEKRLIYIAFHMAGSFIISFVTMLPFYTNGYQECAGTLNQSFVGRLFVAVVPGGISSLSLFWIGFTSIAILAYLLKPKGLHEVTKQLIWLSVFTFMLLFTFVLCHPQWMILFLPFLILLTVQWKENLKINLILEIIAEITLIVVQGFYFHWVYFSETSFEQLIFRSNIKYESGIGNLLDIAERFGISPCIPGAYAVFFVCIAALLILNNPWHPILCRAEETKEMVVEKTARILRIAMLTFYFLITCAIAFT